MIIEKRQIKDYKNYLEIVFNMRKLGFFGGAFNPPTFAHIGLANYAYKVCNLDQVFFVPVGNQYRKEELIDEWHRFRMLEIACKSYPQLQVSDIELGTNQSYTAIEVFELIAQTYPNDELYFIMGADNFLKLPKWKRAEDLIHHYHFIILERNTLSTVPDMIKKNSLLNQYQDHFQVIDWLEYKEINSAEARKRINSNQNVSEFISEEVLHYIESNHLYKI